MRNTSIVGLGALLTFVGTARAGMFEQQIFQTSRLVSAGAQNVRAEFSAPGSQKAAAAPASAWQVYGDPALGLSFQSPTPPVRTENTVELDFGSVTQTNFVVDRSADGGAFMVIIIDLRRLMTDHGIDADSQIQHALQSSHATMISDKTATLGGITGRDVVFRSQDNGTTTAVRAFVSAHIVYEMIASGPLSGLPPESDRFTNSLVLPPWHWLLYAPPEDVPVDRAVPFSRWVQASPTVFTSIEACREEATNRQTASGQVDTQWVRFMDAVCFDPDSKHVRSHHEYKGDSLPVIDVPGVVADPPMR
jgi:hypothetical protein